MDVLLQRHCAKFIYVVPEGLRELLTDISREVIRSSPENIYTFVADYLDALLITRENARVAARVVQSLTEIAETIVSLLVNIGITKEEADKIVSIIQKTFRQYLEERKVYHKEVSEQIEEANLLTDIISEAEIPPEKAEAAAAIIQKAWRDFKRKHEREKYLLSGIIDWRVAARSTIRLYRKTGVTYEEANRAASLIKAAYKGYYTRRMIKKLLEESQRVSETPSVSSEKAEVEEEEKEEFFWDMDYYLGKREKSEGDEMTEEEEEVEEEEEEEESSEIPSAEVVAKRVISDIITAVVPSLALSVAEEEEYYPYDEKLTEGAVTEAVTETTVTETELSQIDEAEEPQQAEIPSPSEEQPQQPEEQPQQPEEPSQPSETPAPEADQPPPAEEAEAPAEGGPAE